MAQLAIKGHQTRGEEVIGILKMLGGKNSTKLVGNASSCGYYIDSDGNIAYHYYSSSYFNDAIQFTLEGFLEKYPYKVGDKVLREPYVGARQICEMRWDSDDNCIKYGIGVGEWFNVSQVQSYKEEIMEGQKKYYDEWLQTDYLEFENNDDTWADEVEVNLGKDYEIQIRGDKTFIVKKKSQYPKTYEECCKILNISPNGDIVYSGLWAYGGEYLEKHLDRLRKFQQLLICRDAYWKMAGEQMGLGKPWEPDWLNTEQDKFVLYTHNNVICSNRFVLGHNVLAFPTVEMRDAFYENFKDLIEACKELL